MMTRSICPDCGAVLDEGETCQSIFEEFLVLEFTDPAFGAVHFLTVACFMIQHRKYSPAGLIWIAQRLHDYFEKGVTPEEIRREAARVTDQTKRNWHVNLRPGDPIPPKIAWSMTIADVHANYHDGASYRELIARWARITLSEMQLMILDSPSVNKSDQS